MLDHHAILLVGASLAETSFLDEIQTHDTEMERYTFDVLPIGDVRKIIMSAYRKPFAKPTKTIVIETGSIGVEAQQALLKVLEEPPLTTKFILVVASRTGLLPTVLSRLAAPQIKQREKPHNELFTMFLKSSYQARLELIAKITKDKDVDRIEFLRTGVMSVLEQKPLIQEADILLWCVSKLFERGASKKMLLEEIARTLTVEA